MRVFDARYVISSPSVDESPPGTRPEVAFIGRSNVGKSSLINLLCNNSKLARTSGTPGKTRLINFFEVDLGAKDGRAENWFFADLPGYGFAKVSQTERRKWKQMIEAYIRKRQNLVNLFVLVDSRHKPQLMDLSFINKLGEWRIPFSIIFTKTDKNKPARTTANVNAFLEALRSSWEQPPVFFTTSAVTKEGRDDVLNFIGKLTSVGNH